jgi:hypothetical protein
MLISKGSVGVIQENMGRGPCCGEQSRNTGHHIKVRLNCALEEIKAPQCSEHE